MQCVETQYCARDQGTYLTRGCLEELRLFSLTKARLVAVLVADHSYNGGEQTCSTKGLFRLAD